MEHIGQFLREIHFEKKSGCLAFKRKGIQKYLFFQRGVLVIAKSTQPQELLGEVLLKLGRISVDTFTNIDLYIDPMESLGKTLIKKGLITQGDLNDGLMFQMREITLNIFPFFDGKLGFQERKEIDKKKFEYMMDVPDLIEEGIRRMDFTPQLQKLIGDKYPVPHKKECLDRLTQEEKDLLATIDGKTSSEELAHSMGVMPEFFWKSLYLFYCLSLIDIKRARVEEEVPEKEEKPKKPPVRKRKKARKKAVPKKKEEEVPEEVRKEERKPSVEIDEKLKEKISEVEKLKNDIPKLDFYQILNVPRTASQKEVKKAYFELARNYHPDRFDRDLPAEIREMVEEVFGIITSAFQTLTNEEEKQGYDAKLAKPAEPDRKELDNQADIKFRQGRNLFSRGKYEESLVFFEEAIKLRSNKASFYLHLARAEAKVPAFQEKAEEDFIKAIDMEPWQADGYVALGEFYAKEGLSVKAKKHFKKALEIEPEHADARKALGSEEGSEKKKGLKGIIKGLGKKKKRKS
ncbi:MAG: J domain-containing protein [Candidatus Aminicenantes bacterium]|nr:J domain-containing protein [Candidatus Aminicenantes bacterium]MDH5706520.1 J domain-containing protein [Candidatus Aminicenantes bacterium]